MNEPPSNKISEKYDLVIVGAGPSGCTVANQISEDYKTLLIDRVAFPRTKPCGGVLVEESKELLKKLGLPLSVFTNPIEIDLEYVDLQNKLAIKTERNLWNVSRERFDWWIFNLLKEKNIDFLSETALIGIDSKKNLVELQLSGSSETKIKTNCLVMASGATTTFVRDYLKKSEIGKYLAIQETSIPIPSSYYKNYTIFIFDNDISDYYSWIIPKKSGLVIGAAIELQRGREKFDLFKRKIMEVFGIVGNGDTEAHLISRPKNMNEVILGEKNILFVGEAAGLITPTTGEGISYAIRSGVNAAVAINEDGLENPFDKYMELSEPLVRSIEIKLETAKKLSDPILRKKFFESIDKSRIIEIPKYNL